MLTFFWGHGCAPFDFQVCSAYLPLKLQHEHSSAGFAGRRKCALTDFGKYTQSK